jgi:hypothetical protein
MISNKVKIALASVTATALLVFGGTAAVGTLTAAETVLSDCTSGPVTQTETDSTFEIECSVPALPAQTQTVIATATATATVTATVTPTPTTSPTPTSTPTATPTGSPSLWPDGTNTGVPAGTPLQASGSVTVNTGGTQANPVVINGLNITGGLTINASNVLVKNSKISNGNYNTVLIKSGVTNVVIQDTEINGRGNTAGNNGVNGPVKLLRVNIYGVENGFVPGSNSEMRDSWIHGLQAPGEPHYDSVQIDGGQSNVLLEHNSIENNHGQTAAVMVDNYFGSATDIVVNNNKLTGGGYTVYADGNFSSTRVVDVEYTNNIIGKGYYGYALIRGARTTVTWTNNRDIVTGNVIPR